MFVLREEERSLEDIQRRIVWLEFRERSRMAEWLALIAELDRRGGVGPRFKGTAEWLAFECRLTPRTARDHVRVARRLAQWPRIADAFGDGLISYAQVRALTRAGADEDEDDLLRVARTSTGAELERHVRQLRSAPSADIAVAREAHNRRTLKWFWNDDDGTLRFFGRLPAADGQALVEAVDTAAHALSGDQGNFVDVETGEVLEQRAPLGALRADALAEICRSGAPRTQLVLHADPAALAAAAQDEGEVCFLRDGPAIPSEVARRLTCECDINLPGHLDKGRDARIGTAAQRRALERRDGRVCAMPGCDRTHGLQIHHLTHWVHGGPTDLHNLALFCTHHHPLLHEHGWSARRTRGGALAVHTPDGHEIHALPARASPEYLAA